MTFAPGPGHRLRRTSRYHRDRGALTALAVLALLSAPAPASAHTALTGSDPADGDTLARPPETIELAFSDDIAAQFVAVTLSVAGGEPSLVPAHTEGTQVLAEVAEDSAGLWQLTYRVVSTDGHPVTGTVGFTAAAPPVADTATPQPQVPGSTAAGTATSSQPSAGAAEASSDSDPAAARESGAGTAWVWVALGVAGVATVAALLLRPPPRGES